MRLQQNPGNDILEDTYTDSCLVLNSYLRRRYFGTDEIIRHPAIVAAAINWTPSKETMDEWQAKLDADGWDKGNNSTFGPLPGEVQ